MGYNPKGLSIQIGRKEKEIIFIDSGLSNMKMLSDFLNRLAESYLSNTRLQYNTPWITYKEKLSRVYLLLHEISAIPGISIQKDTINELSKQVSNDEFLNALEWQLHLFSNVISETLIDSFASISLSLIQSNRINTAQRILKKLIYSHYTNIQEIIKDEKRIAHFNKVFTIVPTLDF